VVVEFWCDPDAARRAAAFAANVTIAATATTMPVTSTSSFFERTGAAPLRA
jgi:hypothetical protein